MTDAYFPNLYAQNNKLVTRGLFYELSYMDTSHSIFTIKDRDIVVGDRTYVSLKAHYLNFCVDDPTEYQFADICFGSWEVWEGIKSSKYVGPVVDKWRKEVEVKIKSVAIKAIAAEMVNGGRSSFSAAKLLLDRGWIDKDSPAALKASQRKKLDEEMKQDIMDEVGEDAKRLGLSIN